MDIIESTTDDSPSTCPLPVEVRTSAIHGRGIFARILIPAHSLIGVYEGPHVQEDDTYVLWIDCEEEGLYGIDGTNDLRYTNHSPTPNATFEGPELIALRDIAPGEEITFHYGDDWDETDDIDAEIEDFGEDGPEEAEIGRDDQDPAAPHWPAEQYV